MQRNWLALFSSFKKMPKCGFVRKVLRWVDPSNMDTGPYEMKTATAFLKAVAVLFSVGFS